MLVSRKYKSICPAPTGTFATLTTNEGKVVKSHLPVIALVIEERKYKEGQHVIPETTVEPVVLDEEGDILDHAELSRQRLIVKLEVR